MHINIKPGYQHCGIGTRLFAALTEHLREIGCKGVMLVVDSYNTNAINFYKRTSLISYSLCASARSWRAGSEKAGKNMKLAVIGTGWIVKSFIDGLKFAPDFELFAVYSRSRERGENSQKRTG